MRDLFLTLLVFATLPLSLLRPHVGVLVWTWLSLMSPHRLSWGFAYDFGFVQLVAVATMAGWLVSREKTALPNTATTLFLFLLTAWVCVTTAFALSPELAQPRLVFTLKLLALPLFVLLVMNTRERIHALVWITAISLGFFAVKGGMFALLTGGGYRVYGPAGSFIEDNNQLALALIVTLPLIRYLQMNSAERWVRWGMGGLLGIAIICILASYSRGALLGLAAVSVFLFLNSRHKVVLIVLMLVAGGGALSMMPERWFDRMSTLGDSAENQDASVQGRFEIWRFAFSVASDRPLVGGGFDVFDEPTAYERYAPGIIVRAPHSIVFQVLGEHGFVGLFLFLAMWATAVAAGSRIRRRTRTRPDLRWAYDLAGMLQAGLMGYAVAGQFLNLAFFDLIYVIIAAMVATDALVARETRASSGARTRPDFSLPHPAGA